MTFGERLQLCMDLRGKSVSDLAQSTGINKGNISKYMRDKISVPTFRIVSKFAKSLNVSPSYLLGLDDTIFVPSVIPTNSLTNDPNSLMKRALLNELNEIATKQDIEKLKMILEVVRTLTK